MLADKMLSVLSKLEWRYATQKFDPNKKIADSTWTSVEQALVLTPSSWGLQTWKFVVVSEQKIKDELVAACYGQKQVKDCSHALVICRSAKLTVDYIDEYIEYVSAVRRIEIKELAREREMILRMHANMNDEQLAEWMTNQCYIALGNLMTAASMLDIDTCPMEGFSKKEFDRILDLSRFDCCSVVVCALGYRSADDGHAQLAKVRFPKEKLFVQI